MTLRIQAFGLLVFWCGWTLFAVGCSRGPQYTLVPVSGALKIDGEPAGNVLVQFMPDASQGTAGPSSSGITDASGHFQLTTVDQRPGASLGSHVVVLFDLDEDRPEQGEESTKPARLSSAYATEKGGVRLTVAEGEPIELNVASESPLDRGMAAISAENATDRWDSVVEELPTEENRDQR